MKQRPWSEFENAHSYVNKETGHTIIVVPYVSSKKHNKIPFLDDKHSVKDIQLFLGKRFNQFVITAFNFYLSDLWRRNKGIEAKFREYLESNGASAWKDPLKTILNKIDKINKDLIKASPEEKVKIKNELFSLLEEYKTLAKNR